MDQDLYKSSYHKMVNCQTQEEFIKGSNDYNNLWYSYLKKSKAACINPNIKYTL